MPPVGRPPATRGVFNLEERTFVPPTEIVLDSSFVAEALITTQPRHAVCAGFLEDIAAAETTVFFNRLLEAELWDFCYVIAVAEVYGRRRARAALRDGRIRRRGTTLRNRVVDAWEALLNALDWLVVDLSEVWPWVPQMMRYGLRSNDAVHAATAAYVDVKAIATLDYDFSAVPARHLELYVPAHRVRACRERRR